MLEKIKNEIVSKKGCIYKFKINNIRNKSEYVEGVINEVYDRVFIVNSVDGLSLSFSFCDVLTGIVEIQEKTC